MIDSFMRDIDLHQITTDKLNEMAGAGTYDRQVGKRVNFALIYASSARGLVGQGIAKTEDEGQVFIDAFFKLYPGIRRYMGDMEYTVRKRGYVTDRLGGMRDLRYIMQDKAWKGIRQAINFPIQAEASSYCNLVIIRLAKVLREKGYSARLLGMVHDSVILDVPQEELVEVVHLVKAEFEQGSYAPFYPNHRLQIPTKIDVKVGTNMANGRELKGWIYPHLSQHLVDFVLDCDYDWYDNKKLTEGEFFERYSEWDV